MRPPAAFLLLAAGVVPTSCGYQWGGLYDEYRDAGVQVNIFDNVSQRRTHEFDLTNAIVHEMSSRGMRVNASDAEYTLEGRILGIRTPSVVEGKTDVILVGSLQFRVEIRLVDSNGEERWRDSRTETVSFVSARAETFDSARQEVFDRLARWAVSRFEKEW